MNEGFSGFIQTIRAEDVIPPAFAERLQKVSQGYITISENLDRELADRKRLLERSRRVMARYQSLCRRRTEIAVALAVRDRLATLEDHERSVREAAQAKADAIDSATRIAACEAVESSICDIIETALHRIMENVQPREHIAGVVRAALRDANLRTRAVLRISSKDKAETIAALADGLGDAWEEVIELDINPMMDRGIMELTTCDGTQMIGQWHQVEVLMAELRAAARNAAPDADKVSPA